MKFVIDRNNFLPAQKVWWDMPNKLKLMVGGFGSGKTYIGALRMIAASFWNPQIPNMYISPSYRMAKRTIIPTIKNILDRANINYYENKTDHEIYIRNWNGVIWFGSGDDPSSLKGPNLGVVGIDEPFLQKREVLDVALSRIRHPEATVREIFLTGTPEQLNWGYDIAENVDNAYDIGVVTASTRDNMHLPDDYVPSMIQGYTEDMVAAYVDGQFRNFTQGRVYSQFSQEYNVTDRGAMPSLPIIVGMDFNVSKMTAAIGYRTASGVHWFDEIVLRDSDTYQMSQRLQERYPGVKIYPDPAGSARKSSSVKSDHSILRANGFQVIAPKSHPPVRDRVNAMNALLRNADGRVRMTIDPTCTELIKDFSRVVWHNGDIDKRDIERTHISDAAGYAVSYLYGITKRTASTIARYAA